MEVYPGRDSVEAAIVEHRKLRDRVLTIHVNNDLVLEEFFVKQGVLCAGTMTGRPFADYVWRKRDLYRDALIIDMMCGSGIAGITALKAGARFATFSDISPAAVECTKDNLEEYKLGDQSIVLEANLFDHEQFCGHRARVILANAPFASGDPPEGDFLAMAFLGGTSLIHRFFRGAKEHLEPGGSLLMPYRKTAGAMNDPGVQGPRHGFRIVSEEVANCLEGVQFGGPLTFYHLKLA